MKRRVFTPNRWNWSQKAEKWVYVKIDEDGKRKYIYRFDPPPEFIELTVKMNQLNEKLLKATDPEENKKIFIKLMTISHKMQEMGKLG
ncbi:MAG: hypothetical protein ACFFE5_16675 [Candidatus Thorarchaeota archaeon]